MSFYSMRLTSATSAYLFSNSAGLIIMGYGTGSAESYYYLASSAMRVLDATFYVNNIHHQDLATEVICTQPTQFRAEIQGDVSTGAGYLKWYIDNVEELAARDQITWSKTFAGGTYQIKMEVLMNDNTTVTKVEAPITTGLAFDLSETATICTNELPYTWRDTTFLAGSTSGNYVFKRKTIHGCDSIVTLNLSIYQRLDLFENATICSNDLPYTWRDTTFLAGTASGNYIFKRKTVHNCDSIVTLNLTIHPTFNLSETSIICNNDLPYIWRDTTFLAGTASGNYIFKRKTVNNCDSIVTLNLTVYPSFDLSEIATTCNNALPFAWRDTTFLAGTASGNYIFKRKTVNNCDSIVTLNLTVHPTFDLSETAIICNNDLPYTWRDTTFLAGTASGNYIFKRKTVHNCDSIVTLNLTIHPTFNLSETSIICNNDLPYAWRDTTFLAGTTSGNYVFKRQTIHGCDSIVTLNLTVHYIGYDIKDATICKGESYDLRNFILNLQNTDIRFYLLPNQTGDGISPIVSPEITTVYYVRAYNSTGCILDRQIQITVTDKPTVNLIPAIINVCEGETINLIPPIVADGGAPITSRMWLLNEQLFDLSTIISYAENNQVLKYVVENNCGTSSSNDAALSVRKHPDLEFPEYEICFGNSVQLHAPASEAYLWLPIMSTEQNPIVTPTETTIYTLQLINGACRTAVAVTVNVFPLPEEVTVRQSRLNQVRILDGNNYIYQLNNNPPTFETVINSLSSGFHFLEVRNSYGCFIRQLFFVRGLNIPPYFSPNGDGINDVWEIENLSAFPGAKVRIYDRSGKLLEILNADRPAWDGKFNGNHMPSTDYWYLLEIPEFRETQTGHFTLKR